MAMTSHLDDFNVDAETKQVLDLALEMTARPSALQTILRTKSSANASSNLPGPASGVPTWRVWRAAPSRSAQILSKILQRDSHALIAEQGCAGFALFRSLAAFSACRSWVDCTISTSGFDFR